MNGTRRFSRGHTCGPCCSAASPPLSAGFLGICGEWQLWNHFSFCQVVVRLSGVSLLGWPLLGNSLENIWFSLKDKNTHQKLPSSAPKHKHKTISLSLGNPGGEPVQREGPRGSQHPNVILMSDHKRAWEAPISRTCSADTLFCERIRDSFYHHFFSR